MRFLIGLVVLGSVIGIASTVPPDITSSWAQVTTTEPGAPAGQPTGSAAEAGTRSTSSGQGWWSSFSAWVKSAVEVVARPAVWGILLGAVIITGGIIVLRRTVHAGADPLILRLTPSFFFWLGMMYTALLLLVAIIYILCFPEREPTLLAGILPIAVPWFGALGAVTISLEGVFLWNNQWDRKYNYWHIGRPLFGAVLGIVAFFLFVVIGAAAGTPPKFLDGTVPLEKIPLKDFIIYYVVAFLVGYREETFRDLIKRATDLILKPGTQAPPAPAVTFRIGGVPQQEIQCPDSAVGQAAAPVAVEIQNAGNAPLVAPTVTIVPVAPTPPNTFATVNDLVTPGGDLAAGQVRTVGVTFTPPAAGGPDFTATLTVTAANLPEPRTIRVRGHRT